MNVTEHDRGSNLWAEFEAYCNARIETLRRENEMDKDPIATAKLRGRIDEIKRFLRAGEPAREIVTGDD